MSTVSFLHDGCCQFSLQRSVLWNGFVALPNRCEHRFYPISSATPMCSSNGKSDAVFINAGLAGLECGQDEIVCQFLSMGRNCVGKKTWITPWKITVFLMGKVHYFYGCLLLILFGSLMSAAFARFLTTIFQDSRAHQEALAEGAASQPGRGFTINSPGE